MTVRLNIEYILGPQFLLGASDDDDVDAGAFFYLFLKDVKKMKENDDMLQIIWKGHKKLGTSVGVATSGIASA